MNQPGPSGPQNDETSAPNQTTGEDRSLDRPPMAPVPAGGMGSEEQADKTGLGGEIVGEGSDRAAGVPAPFSEGDSPPNDESAVRVGSPFAVDPQAAVTRQPGESLQDLGPMKYTAMGAVSASILVVGFAAAAAYFFPAGGTLVAALGCLLSILGMYSSYRLAAACLLTLHLCLFVLSYGRSLG